MNTCALTRILVPAFLAGFVVSVLTGNEPLAWGTAAAVAVAVVVAGRIRGTQRSCGINTSVAAKADQAPAAELVDAPR